jgi:hypothetical protein
MAEYESLATYVGVSSGATRDSVSSGDDNFD